MQSGKLRHRVDIQASTVTLAADGQPSYAWATVVSAWAWIKPLSAKEFLSMRSQTSDITHAVIMRYEDYPSLTMAHRIKHGDRVLNIQSLMNEGERDRQWSAMCVEVA